MTQTISFTLTDRAASIIEEIPNGKRSEWLSQLVETNGYSPKGILVARLNELQKQFKDNKMELNVDIVEVE